MKTIEEIKSVKTESKLEEVVLENILEEIEGSYEDRAEDFFEDLFQNGCISGMVSALVLYSDTEAFFEEHKEEINSLLSETLENIGFNSPIELFGDKFDKEDFLCLETQNQNLLSWFAFEETARKIAERLGMDV